MLKYLNNNSGHQYTCGILVNKEATLILQATVKGDMSVTPTLSLRRYWHGIIVVGDPTEDHFDVEPAETPLLDNSAFYGVLNSKHGLVKLEANARIEIAETGIHSFDGGIVEAFDVMVDNSPKGDAPLFLNNKFGLKIENSKQVTSSKLESSATRLNNVRFEFDDYVSDAFSGPGTGYVSAAGFHLVQIIGSNGIYFGGCDFVNTDGDIHTGHQNYYNYDRGVGIQLKEKNEHNDYIGKPSVIIGEAGDVFYTPAIGSAAVDADPTCKYVKILGHETETEDFVGDPRDAPGTSKTIQKRYGCKFKLLSQALTTTDYFYSYTDFAEKVAVAYATFRDNYDQISLDVFQVDIHSSDISKDDGVMDYYFNSPSFTGSDMKQIEINKCAEALVYDNIITSSAGLYGAKAESIGIFNVGSNSSSIAKKILVRYNFIDGDNSFTNIASYGLKASGNLTNLEWTCNTFKNNDIDVSYSGSSGPRKNPLDGKPASNDYSGQTFDIENLTTNVVEYYKISSSSPSPSVNNQSLFLFRGYLLEGSPCEIKCDELEKLRNDLYDPNLVNIEQVENDNLGLYPNPSFGSIYLNSDQSVSLFGGEISIYNSMGVLQLHRIYTQDKSIDVSTLASGLYILTLEKDGFFYTSKFIKR